MTKVEVGRHQRVKFICTLIGCAIVLLPSGVVWYWGNLSIYVYSYSHFHKDNNNNNHNNNHINNSNGIHDVKTPWLISIYIIMWSSAMLTTGYLTKRISRRFLAVLAVALFNGGLLSSYFVLDTSIKLLNVTVGVMCGFGNGVLFAIVLQTAVEWAEKRVGLTISAALSGNSIGAVVVNQLATHYVNPNNLKVDTDVGRIKYFSQKSILDKVPRVFLILTAFSLSCHILGVIFVYVRPRQTKSKEQGCQKNLYSPEPVKSHEGSAHPPLQQTNEVNPNAIHQEEASPPAIASNLELNTSINYEETLPILRPGDQSSLSPKQVLCSISFYVIWMMLATVDIGQVLICNYYKAFGQEFIKDDHFLANLGTALCVVNIIMRVAWGFMLDHINYKTSLVFFASTLSLINNFYFFTPRLHRWFFFFWTLAYGGVSCGVYINFTSIVTFLYGKEHFNTNFGLLFTATIAVNLVIPPYFRFLLQQWGWFAIFASTSCLCLLSLVLVIILLSHKKRTV